MSIGKGKSVTALISLTVINATWRFLLSTRYSDKESFSSALSFSEGELLWFSAIVAFGVYGEARQTSWWKERHSRLAWWVALALIGEFMADAQIWRASASLQVVSDALLADSEKKASNAIAEAAKANERASVANERAARLEYESSATNLRIAKIGAPRLLTQAQQQSISSEMRKHKSVRFDMAVAPNDPEAENFRLILQNVFFLGGWVQQDWRLPTATLPIAMSPDNGGFAVGMLVGNGVEFFLEPNSDLTGFDETEDILAAVLQLQKNGIAADFSVMDSVETHIPAAALLEMKDGDKYAPVHVVIGTRPMQPPSSQ